MLNLNFKPKPNQIVPLTLPRY